MASQGWWLSRQRALGAVLGRLSHLAVRACNMVINIEGGEGGREGGPASLIFILEITRYRGEALGTGRQAANTTGYYFHFSGRRLAGPGQ